MHGLYDGVVISLDGRQPRPRKKSPRYEWRGQVYLPLPSSAVKLITIPRVFVSLLFFALPVFAGNESAVALKEVQPLAESWQFNLAAPIWLAGVEGQTGVHGKAVGVDVGPSSILRPLNFTTSLSAEARKGPLGFYADFLYLDDRAGVATPGLVSSLDLRGDEYLADAEVNWRVIDGPRGWLEVRAGCRYTNLYSRLGLNPDSGAIEKASVRLTDASAAEANKILSDALHGVLDGKDPVLPLPPLAADQKEKLLDLIQKAKQDPELAAALQSGVQARIDQAKRNVQEKIECILHRVLSQTFSLGEAWFDPYVGLAGRCNFSGPFYLIAKADAGGFGVGSQFTWQGYGALGCQFTRRVYSEVGYRYLYVDYQHGGFVYDIATRGAQITVGVVF